MILPSHTESINGKGEREGGGEGEGYCFLVAKARILSYKQ